MRLCSRMEAVMRISAHGIEKLKKKASPLASPLPCFIAGFVLGGLSVLLGILGLGHSPWKPSVGATKVIRIKLKIIPCRDPASPKKNEINDAVTKEVEEIIMNRLINENAPVSITHRGNQIISIDLQKKTDMERVKELVSMRGYLEFKEQVVNRPAGTLEWRTVLDGSYLQKNGATVGFNAATKRPYLLFLLNDEGTRKFAEITRRNMNRPIGIFIDGKLVDAPVIKEAITGGTGVIEGKGLSRAAFENMRTILNAGCLPAGVQILDCRVVEIEPQQ